MKDQKKSNMLEELINVVEKATNIEFPSELKKQIKIKKVTPKEFYEKVVETTEYAFDRELTDIEKLGINLTCNSKDSGFLAYMNASPKHNTIYVCKENMEHNFKQNYKKLVAPFLAHEIGHLYLSYMYPEYLKMLRENSNNPKIRDLIRNDELFADYFMIQTHLSLKPDHKRSQMIKQCLPYYNTRLSWYANPMMKSEDPVKDIIKKFEEIAK